MLLLWGDASGMASLKAALQTVSESDVDVRLGEGATLTIVKSDAGPEYSRVLSAEGHLRWECSVDMLRHAAELIEPLMTTGQGHQYLNASGEADEIMISTGEYPADFM